MTRADAIARAQAQIPSGAFLKELDRRVGFKTESLNAERAGDLRAYLEEELQPAFAELDFTSRLIESPSGKSPFLLAEHREGASLPTVLMYGHGDVVDGMVGEWRDGLDPFRLTQIGRLQRQVHRRNGRGNRLARSRRGLRLAAG